MRIPQGRQTSDLAVFELDEPGGGDSRAVEEGGVLESAGLLDPDIKVEARIGNLDEWCQQLIDERDLPMRRTKIQVFFLTDVRSSWLNIVAGDTCNSFFGPLAFFTSLFT